MYVQRLCIHNEYEINVNHLNQPYHERATRNYPSLSSVHWTIWFGVRQRFLHAPEHVEIRDRLQDIRGVDIRLTWISKDDFYKTPQDFINDILV